MAKKEQKGQGVKLAIRQAGEGGITKQELNNITKSTGQSADTVIRRLDQVNSNLKSNDLARIGLNSGAANMLINQNTKNPVSPFSQGKGYGTGQIGKALQSMMGSPGSAGGVIKGQQVFNQPATPAQLMIGGTQIRGGGRVAVKGFGQQYTLPEQDKTVIKNPVGGEGYVPNQVNSNQTVQDPVVADPVATDPVASTSDPGSGMLSGGGVGAAGANRLGRAKSRLRQLGIYGKGTGLLGRGLQYGNTLNTGR
jgi:hypothetical protein